MPQNLNQTTLSSFKYPFKPRTAFWKQPTQNNFLHFLKTFPHRQTNKKSNQNHRQNQVLISTCDFHRITRWKLGLIRRPALSQHRHHQRARYLHLHLDGKALNFYLELPEATRNDLHNSLQELRKRYAGADQRRNFELDIQSQKNSQTIFSPTYKSSQ